MSKDVTEKRLEEFDDVFVDIFNNLLFAGEEILHEEAHVVVDYKNHDAGQVVISGWCTDKASSKVFRSLELRINEIQQELAPLERKDVAMAMGEAYAMSGFSITLSLEEFVEAEEMTLIGEREDGTKIEILSYVKKLLTK